MPDLNDIYERELQKAIVRAQRKIRKIYEQSIIEISMKASTVNLKKQPFSLSLYPLLDKEIESKVKSMHKDIYKNIVDSTKKAWNLSNKKNDRIVDKRFASNKPGKRARQILYDPNKQAYEAFINRKEKGLNLSERVWNTLDPFKKEMEQSLGLAMNKGKSAASMATELKQYLNEPEKLFRRVRNEEGKLVLSKAAREYHPGQGVYRSSYKNALRVSRTENNMAYRTADHERWQDMPFVTGIEIRLSKNHPRYDICDNLKGKYPKDFKWSGWHPQCLCHQIPIMMSEEEYNKLEDQILAGEDLTQGSANQVTSPPPEFGQYVSQNKKRIEGWKNKPYWVKDNQQYFDQAKPIKVDAIPLANGLKAKGNSIKSQFTNIDDSIKERVNEALTSIDLVHGDGILKDIPFESVDKSFEAAFALLGNEPNKIMLSSKAIAPEISLVHEMGHYLDWYSIGRKGSFATHQPGHSIQKVLEAAEDTKSIKELRRMAKERYVTDDGKLKWLTPEETDHVNYLLEPHEIWARLYSQFIAGRSNSKTLENGLKKRRKLEKLQFMPRHWDRKDFEVIDEAMEEFLIGRGWISR